MRDINPTARGFAILIVIAAIITALQLQVGLQVIILFLQILFLLAIVYVIFMLWRRRREEISMWSTRSRAVFYGGAGLALADIGLAFTPWFPETGIDSVVFLLALGAGGYAMYRAWRDEHTYGYCEETRAAAPSSESRMARISCAVPTKIGVSRSV